MRNLALAVSLKLALTSTGAIGEELLGDPAAGRQLAENVCSVCHVIAEGETAKSEIEGAPAFPDLANEPQVTALSLRVFLQTPHERMPDLRLDANETDDVIAYILSQER